MCLYTSIMMFCGAVCVECTYYNSEKIGLNYVLAIGAVCETYIESVPSLIT